MTRFRDWWDKCDVNLQDSLYDAARKGWYAAMAAETAAPLEKANNALLLIRTWTEQGLLDELGKRKDKKKELLEFIDRAAPAGTDVSLAPRTSLAAFRSVLSSAIEQIESPDYGGGVSMAILQEMKNVLRTDGVQPAVSLNENAAPAQKEKEFLG